VIYVRKALSDAQQLAIKIEQNTEDRTVTATELKVRRAGAFELLLLGKQAVLTFAHLAGPRRPAGRSLRLQAVWQRASPLP